MHEQTAFWTVDNASSLATYNWLSWHLTKKVTSFQLPNTNNFSYFPTYFYYSMGMSILFFCFLPINKTFSPTTTCPNPHFNQENNSC